MRTGMIDAYMHTCIHMYVYMIKFQTIIAMFEEGIIRVRKRKYPSIVYVFRAHSHDIVR